MQRLGIAIVAVLAACGGRPTTSPTAKPNVLVFMVDTLRADALGCYGSPQVRTPNVDAFAADGVRFQHAFAQSSWTRGSIASLFTGTYAWTHGVRDRKDSLSPVPPTLAELLRGARYRTGAIISNPNIDVRFGFERGFDEYLRLYTWDRTSKVYGDDLIAPAARVVDETLAWLDRNRERPFFLFVLAIDPHDPYHPPAPYDRLYDPTYRGTFDGSLEPMRQSLPIAVSRRDLVHMRALYDGEVTYMDEQFGRLVRALEERRLMQDTAVVFTSDHGEEFLDHGGWGHGFTLFDEQVRVPLIVRAPSVARGRVVDELVELRDVFAMVLSLAGVPVPDGLGLRDIAPCLRGTCETRRTAVATLDLDGHGIQAVRDERYKLLWRPRQQSLILHDVMADPQEELDFRAEAPDAVANLGRQLDEVRAAAPPLPPPPPNPMRLEPPPLDERVDKALRALGYLR